MKNKIKFNRKITDSKQKLEFAKSIANSSKKLTKTYLSFESNLAKFLKFVSDRIDQYVLNPKLSGVVALVLTLALYFSVNVGIGETLFTPSKNAESINDVPVTVLANTEIYEISGLDQNVDIKIIGDMQSVQMAKIQGGFKVVADLTGLGEGKHQIEYVASNFPKGVEVIIQPSNAVIEIEKKVSWSFNLGYEFINQDKMDSTLVLEEPELELQEVIVRTSQKNIDKISYVKALINVADAKEDFETNATIVAYDQEGNKLDVEILPKTVKAKVNVASPSKDVPIIIEPKGIIPNNKAIDDIVLDHQAVTIYGPEDILDQIDSIVIPIDVTNVTKDTVQVTPLYLPQGVSKSSITKVTYSIKLVDSSTKIIENIPLKWKNNVNGYKPNVEEKYANIEVVCTGAQSHLDNLTPGNIEAWIDLSEVELGEQELTVYVTGTDLTLRYQAVVEKIPVNISN